MNLEKVVQTVSTVATSGAKKTLSKAMSAVSAVKSSAPEKLTTALDGLASAKKVLISKKNKVGTIPNTIEALTKDSAKHGIDAKEAYNGARALISATGERSGKSAAESAAVFIKAGKSGYEKGFGPSTQILTTAERKVELKSKYAEKLENKINDKIKQQVLGYHGICTGEKVDLLSRFEKGQKLPLSSKNIEFAKTFSVLHNEATDNGTAMTNLAKLLR